MKRVGLLIAVLAACIIMTSCESKNVKEAKQAFEEGKYDTVVKCLKKEEELNDELTEEYNVAKAHVAYDDGEYVEAIEYAIKVEDGKELEVYKMSKEEIVKASLKKGETKTLFKAIDADPDIAKYVADEVIKACDELNYNGFIVLSRLKKKLPDGEIKDKIVDYYKESNLNKPKAFLLGKWEWQEDADAKTIVKVVTYQDNLIGTITKVGDLEKQFHYEKDDVYWSNYEFTSTSQFTCNNIGRTYAGVIVDNMAVGKIDYKNNEISLHLTAAGGHELVNGSDRIWLRYTE